jgi:hypothetical protein
MAAARWKLMRRDPVFKRWRIRAACLTGTAALRDYPSPHLHVPYSGPRLDLVSWGTDSDCCDLEEAVCQWRVQGNVLKLVFGCRKVE